MPPRRKDETQAAAGLAAVAPLATRWIERVLAQHDPPLTVPQYLALRAIELERAYRAPSSHGGPGVSVPAVSQLIAALAGAGLVEREPSEGDRRRMTLTLSRTGRRAYKGAETALGKELGSLLSDLPRPEADALARLLPQVESALSGAPPPRRPAHPPPPPH